MGSKSNFQGLKGDRALKFSQISNLNVFLFLHIKFEKGMEINFQSLEGLGIHKLYQIPIFKKSIGPNTSLSTPSQNLVIFYNIHRESIHSSSPAR